MSARAQFIAKKQLEKAALRPLGVSNRRRVFSGDAQSPAYEAEILRLPLYSGISGYESNVLQNTSTGALYFMVGIDDPMTSTYIIAP